MRFSIILSIDCPYSASIREFMPNTKALWQTEGDSNYEYSYLGGEWKKGKHRKLCGVVGEKLFKKIVDCCGLRMSSTETLGMLGAPHLGGIGNSPAFSFNCDDEPSAIISAYVCPLPNKKEQKRFPLDENGWKKIKEFLLKEYE